MKNANDSDDDDIDGDDDGDDDVNHPRHRLWDQSIMGRVGGSH